MADGSRSEESALNSESTITTQKMSPFGPKIALAAVAATRVSPAMVDSGRTRMKAT